MLPTSRNTNYNAATPVKSTDLDDIQDCIIGVKHPEIEDPLGAPFWLMDNGGNATFDGANDQWTFAAITKMICGIRLPVGTRITTVTWVYNRANVGNVTLKLRRRDNTVARAAAADVASVVDNASNGWQNNAQVYNHVMAAGFNYWLQAQFDNAAHVFSGARAKRDRL